MADMTANEAKNPNFRRFVGATVESKMLRAGLHCLHNTNPIVLVCNTARDQKRVMEFLNHFFHSFSAFDPNFEMNLLDLPLSRIWGPDRFSSQVHSIISKTAVLAHVVKKTRKLVVVATLDSLCQLTCDHSILEQSQVCLSVGEEIDFSELEAQFVELGYFEAGRVEQPGAFAFRGGILDIFAVGEQHPIRIEFLGDIISSIRTFDSETQASIKEQTSVSICLATEVYIRTTEEREYRQKLYDVMLEKELPSEDRNMIMEYFDQRRFSSIPGWKVKLRGQSVSFLELLSERSFDFIGLEPVEVCIQTFEQILEDCESLCDSQVEIEPAHHFLTDEKRITSSFFKSLKVQFGLESSSKEETEFVKLKDFEYDQLGWKQILKRMIDSDQTGVVVCQDLEQLAQIKKILELYIEGSEQNGIEIVEHLDPLDIENLPTHSSAISILLTVGSLQRTVFLSPPYLWFLPSLLFLGKKAAAKSQRRRLKNALQSLDELEPGDYIVEVDHGIGRYLGLKTLNNNGISQDFLHIEYSGGDLIYIPIDRVDGIEKYSGKSAFAPSLDKLRSNSWEIRKNKVKKATRDIAEELLKIYAARKAARPHQYGPITDIYQSFEHDFQYIETADQLKAIEDIHSDLSSKEGMDRIIVGDVGFGKTEVAMRACMRAVIENLQVILLAPTTVLSYQHYQSFEKRFSKYGLRLGLANRFVKRIDIKQNLLEFSEGKIDILIGTHRLLSKDVRAKNLGLIIIDEEQKFGVQHKARIGQLKANADVLTMTATPIPRTLHSAMIGLKQVSVLMTPPLNRMPIKTYKILDDDGLIEDAVKIEMKRGGQVFIVHNRVQDIDTYAARISRLVPKARVAIGHAQMADDALEKLIIDFIHGKFDVLVCTTIVESGIDMPNVNTIIIDQAHMFGLGQLYQLRGRVGRSDVQAYAYLICPPPGKLTIEAEARIDSILTHQELGSGFQIANRDLEIRGAGNLLGAEQSGKIASVGLQTYTKLLEQAVHELSGKTETQEISVPEPELQLDIEALIPSNYIEGEAERLAIYRQFFRVSSVGEVLQIKNAIKDRFGPLPESVEALATVAELKTILRELRVKICKQLSESKFDLHFHNLSRDKIKHLQDLQSSKSNQLQFGPQFNLICQSKGSGNQALTYLCQMLSV